MKYTAKGHGQVPGTGFSMQVMRNLNILLIFAAVTHVAEEFFFGWIDWVHTFVPGVTSGQFLIINALFISLCLTGIVLSGITFRLSLFALVLINIPFHVVPALLHLHYSPGLVTALLFYLPLGLYAYYIAVYSGDVPVSKIRLSLLLGAFWMSVPLLFQLIGLH